MCVFLVCTTEATKKAKTIASLSNQNKLTQPPSISFSFCCCFFLHFVICCCFPAALIQQCLNWSWFSFYGNKIAISRVRPELTMNAVNVPNHFLPKRRRHHHHGGFHCKHGTDWFPWKDTQPFEVYANPGALSQAARTAGCRHAHRPLPWCCWYMSAQRFCTSFVF